jgi:hypothetical protein
VNSIETIPDKPSPSANIYLQMKVKHFNVKIPQSGKSEVPNDLTRSMGREQKGSTPSSED